MRQIEPIAVDMLHAALTWEPEVKLIGDVSAEEIAKLAASCLSCCPLCGSDPGVNIDCELCPVLSELRP